MHATDIFGNPVRPDVLTSKRRALRQAQLYASTPTLKTNRRPAPLRAKSYESRRPDRSPYLIAAEAGRFKMKGLTKHWTSGRPSFALNPGAYRWDRQQSMQRVIEAELMAHVNKDVPSAVATPLPFPGSGEHTRSSHPEQDALSKLLEIHQRGATWINPDASVPTLLHPEDPSYVDLYRNYLQDREDRIAFKQKRCYLEHQKFVIRPETKLRTQQQQREAVRAAVLPRIVNPVDDPDFFMPLSLKVKRAHRRTIEDPDEGADTVPYQRHVFREELSRLCSGKPHGFFDGLPLSLTGAPSSSATPDRSVPISSATQQQVSPSTGVCSPERLRGAWATIDRAKAYPHQMQVAMHHYREDTSLRKSVALAAGARPPSPTSTLSSSSPLS